MALLRSFLNKLRRANLSSSRKAMTWLASLAVVMSPLIGVASPASALTCNPGQTGSFNGGTGTQSDPWQIATVAQLRLLDSQYTSDSCLNSSYYFRQTADLDLSSYANWTPIGSSGIGTIYNFDGDNHLITGLSITTAHDYGNGLFARLGGASKNIRVIAPKISGTATLAGGIAASIEGNVINSSVEGGTISGVQYVGGIGGFLGGNLTNTWSSANVTAIHASSTEYVGGLVGYSIRGTLSGSYSIGTVSSPRYHGGLIGLTYNNSDPSFQSQISSSYAANGVGTSGGTGGGIIGFEWAYTPYSGGQSFWDVELSGLNNYRGASSSGTGTPLPAGKTTAQMKDFATFGPAGAAWKITNGTGTFNASTAVWGICSSANGGYPFLLWQDTSGNACLTPDRPTAVTPVVSNQAAAVSWTAPRASGASAVTSYTVTSYPGAKTCTAVAPNLSCTVTGLTNGQAYTFGVSATNASGTGWIGWSGSGNTPLAPPTAVVSGTPTAVAAASSATVSWTNSVVAGVTGYLVTSNPGGFTCASASSPCIVTGLTNGTAYTFTVKTTNSAGASANSSTASLAVTPLSVPGAPGAPSVSTSVAQATLTWAAPPDSGGSTITEYTATSSPGSLTCVVSGLTCTITGLTNGTAYTFSVKAKNILGYGLASVASSIATPRTTPNAPTSVTGTSHNSSASVSWIAPASDGGATITEYQVRAYDSSDISRGICTVVMPSSLSCDVTGLTNGVSYRFGVFAYNSEGYGQRSSLSSVVTPLSKPGIPTSVLVLAGDESALVTWTPPTDDGGAALTSFTAISSPGGHTCTATSPSTICYVPGLTNGVAYSFTVTARSAAFATVGASDPSLASAVVTPRTVPTAPVISSVTPGDDEFVVSFTPPSSDGGDAITGYEYSRDNGATWHAMASTGTSSPQRIAGLTTSTTYSIQLRAVNAAGESVASNAVSATFVSAPGAPTGLTGVAGNNGVALTWIPPVITGGLSLVSYTATASPGGASCTVLVPATTCDLVGLTNGVNYTFTVTATNNIGTSVASTQSVGLMPLPPWQSDTTFEIVIAVTVGDPVAGGMAEFTSSGLEPGAPWSLIVRSSPRLLTSGNAGAAGTILGNAVIPAGLEAGWHSLTLSGRDYLGREASSTKWFLINSSGELVSSSSSDPTVSPILASTGRYFSGMMHVAALMMLLGAVMVCLKGTRRRFS